MPTSVPTGHQFRYVEYASWIGSGGGNCMASARRDREPTGRERTARGRMAGLHKPERGDRVARGQNLERAVQILEALTRIWNIFYFSFPDIAHPGCSFRKFPGI